MWCTSSFYSSDTMLSEYTANYLFILWFSNQRAFLCDSFFLFLSRRARKPSPSKRTDSLLRLRALTATRAGRATSAWMTTARKVAEVALECPSCKSPIQEAICRFTCWRALM